MKYVSHDGVVIRRASQTALPEIWVNGEWKPFPEEEDGDISKSSTAAWFEGTPLTEEEAKARMKKQG